MEHLTCIGIECDADLAFDDLQARGEQYLTENPRCVDDAVADLEPHDLSTIIYTSGTTGRPKGVELINQNWTYEAEAVASLDFVDENEVLYLWLPLSHVFGRDLLSIQLRVGFRSVVDGRVDKIMDGLAATSPTALVAVPRVFEKVRAAVVTMNPNGSLKGRISRWAFNVGKKTTPYRIAGKPMPATLRASYALAHKLVFSKLHDRLGGRLRILISGSAKLSQQIQEWFFAAGLSVVEGYGATETSAIAFLDVPSEVPRFGTVGKPLPGMRTKTGEDGELLLSGPIIARGYHNMSEETAEAFVDGWFATGDIGEFDENGDFSLRERKKDLFKTSNGKYVAPQKVEGTIMANVPYVSQVVAVGDDRPYITALVALDRPMLERWAERRGLSDMGYAELSQLPEIKTSIDRRMKRANERLERWEQVKRYVILPHELSMADGTLTASLKVRRFEVYRVYADQIDAMYADKTRSDLVSE